MAFDPMKFGRIFQQFATEDDVALEIAARALRNHMKNAGVHPSEIKFDHTTHSSSSSNDKTQRALDAALKEINEFYRVKQDLQRQIAILHQQARSNSAKVASANRKANSQAAENLRLIAEIAELKAAKPIESSLNLADRLKSLVEDYAALNDAAKNAQGEADSLREIIERQAVELRDIKALHSADIESLNTRIQIAEKITAYMAEHLSEGIVNRCRYNGEKYYFESELKGEPSWARR